MGEGRAHEGGPQVTQADYLEKVADVGSALRYARLGVDMALAELEYMRSTDRCDEGARFLREPELQVALASLKRNSDTVKDTLMRATGWLGLPERDPEDAHERALDVPESEAEHDARVQQ